MNAIKQLPDRVKHLTIGIIAIMGIGLFGLSVYGESLPKHETPITIIAPAPAMDQGNV